MTISVAWIRKGAESEELWMGSDSRLSGDGNIWDDCPKLLTLPRRDTIAGFTGTTAQAYPMLFASCECDCFISICGQRQL